jgi:hypothetical protein
VRGPGLMLGYHQQPEAAGEAVVARCRLAPCLPRETTVHQNNPVKA